MTLATTLNRVAYAGDAVTVTYPYPFEIFLTTDLQVYDVVNATGVATLLTLGVDYTVSGAGVPTGGNVVRTVATALNHTVVVIRVEPYTQASAFPSNDKFPTTVLETALDKLTMLVQQLNEVDGRALKLAVTSLFSNLTLPDPVAGKVLAWKDATGLQNVDVVPSGGLTVPVTFANGGTGANYATRDALMLGLNAAQWKQGADIASAATVTLPNPLDGGLIKITGSVGISALSTTGIAVGTRIALWFTGTPVLTHGANFFLQGATNYTVVANDVFEFIYLGASKWQELRRVYQAAAVGTKFLRDDGTFQPLSTAWTTPAYNAGDFTAGGSQTWTVDAGDVITYAYNVVGKTMTVAFGINTTTVGGTPHSELRIKIPGGFTSAKLMYSNIRTVDNGAAGASGYAQVDAAGTIIKCFRDFVPSNWSAATNATYVLGQITFEVQ